MYFSEIMSRFLEEQKISLISYQRNEEDLKHFLDNLFIDEEETNAEFVMDLIISKREKSVENLLKEQDNYFGFSLVEEGFRYRFLDFKVYTSFSKEMAMCEFNTFIDENEQHLSKKSFLRYAFNHLKKESLFPNDYELYFASKSPEKEWENVTHCLLYKNDELLHSMPLSKILQKISQQGKKMYMDLFVLEKWADELFNIIEENEKKHS